MMATVETQLLSTIHRMLRQQSDLNERLSQGPRKITVARNGEAQFESRLEELKSTSTKTKMAADEKQLQLKTREDRIEDLKNKRNACDSNREYQLLNDQIAADQQANSVLSDEILEQLDKIDQLDAAIGTAKDNLAKAQEETARVTGTVEEELSLIKADLDRVNQELSELETQLPGEIKAEYRRMVDALGENALALVEDNTCGHCYRVITAQVITELMMKNVVFCKSCGSLLYMSEGATV